MSDAKSKAEARRQRILQSGEKRIKYIFGEEKSPELTEEEKRSIEEKKIQLEKIQKEKQNATNSSKDSSQNQTNNSNNVQWKRKILLLTVAICAAGSPITNYSGFLITLFLLFSFISVEYLDIFTFNGIEFSLQSGVMILFQQRSIIGNEMLLFIGSFLIGYFFKQFAFSPTL